MPARPLRGAAVLCAPLALAAVLAPATPALAATFHPTTVPTGVSAREWSRVAQLSPALQVLRACEASGNYRANTGNGYYGAYQFSAATWHRVGMRGLPHRATAAVQDVAAVRLHDRRRSWADWGSCGRRATAVRG